MSSLVFLKSTWTSYCLIRRNFKKSWAVKRFYGKFVQVIGLRDFRCYLLACRFVEFDISVICHLFMLSFGSFLLQDMFLRLRVFAFKGQNMKFKL